MILILWALYLLPNIGVVNPAIIPRDETNVFPTNTSTPYAMRDAPCPCLRSHTDIIWSCMATIFACCWVSVHPNIPSRGTTKLRLILRRLDLMFWSIVTPEFVVGWAMRQWYGARVLEEKYKAINPNWTKAHGHFLQMGGFMLYDPKTEQPLNVLTCETFQQLLSEERIKMPRISEGDIQDWGKADGLSKAVVCLQTTWFLAQCIARKSQGLSMTELELVAAALAAYNGVMYYFWWDKPLNVLSTFAVYLLDENDNEPHDDSHSLDRTDHETSASHVAERGHSPLSPPRQEEATQEQTNHIDNTDEQEVPMFVAMCHVFNRSVIAAHQLNIRTPCFLKFLVIVYGKLSQMSLVFDLVNTEPVIATTHVPDFYALPIPVDSHGPRFFLSAIIATIGAQFGAIHCAAWSFAFPSTAEKVLWRIGATFITAMLISWHFGVLVAYLTVFLTRRFKRTNRAFDVFDDSLAGFVLCAGPILYIVARLFLLVVAVTALRHIPQTAFYQVEWLSFLPHI